MWLSMRLGSLMLCSCACQAAVLTNPFDRLPTTLITGTQKTASTMGGADGVELQYLSDDFGGLDTTPRAFSSSVAKVLNVLSRAAMAS